MQTTEHLTITLPIEIAQIVRNKIANGEYATESEVIGDGLLSLIARDNDLSEWLNSEVLPAYDALRANPESAVSLGDVRNALLVAQAKLAQHQR